MSEPVFVDQREFHYNHAPVSVIHDIIYAAAAVVSSPVWGYRMARTGKWRTDWHGRLGHTSVLPRVDPEVKTILFHAVSVGEVNAIRELVHQLVQHGSRLRLVIAATTDTGFARAVDLYGNQHRVVRYPLDFSASVERFLDTLQPDLVALVELEVWPNFVQQCHQRKIPVVIVNGRLSSRSFKRYCWIRPLVQPTFARLTRVGAQTQAYAQRFIHLGAPQAQVRVLDSMKWDTAHVVAADQPAAHIIPGALSLAQELGLDLQRPIIVAGSTAPGEDKLLIDTCPPEAQLVIVPRKPEWFEQTVRLAPNIIRRSQHRQGRRAVDGARLFLLDTMGELRQAYALADVCIVGRSFLGLYGSDMIEPVALGKPTLIGPFHSDFQDTVDALVAGQGIIVTDQPGVQARNLLQDPAQARALADRGRQVIVSRQGASQRHAAMMLELLDPGIRRCTEPSVSREETASIVDSVRHPPCP